MPDRTVEAYYQSEAMRAYWSGEWCGECRYGVVEDPPCCYREEAR